MRTLKRGSVRVLVDVVREPTTMPGAFGGKALRNAREAARLFYAYRESKHIPENKEAFLCLHLNGKHEPISIDLVSLGSLQASIVHPREVFRPAIAIGAAQIVICHNHPSGNPDPSSEDDDVTNRLKKAGRLLGIPMLDHIILGNNRFYTFAEERQLLMSIGGIDEG